mgnify:CR=1 FL=1
MNALYDFQIEYTFSDNKLADLDRSICLLLSTRAGTIPLDRELGLSMDFIDMPPETAKSLYTAEVSEKIATLIPGVRVKSVSWDKGNNGKMKSKVVITGVCNICNQKYPRYIFH